VYNVHGDVVSRKMVAHRVSEDVASIFEGSPELLKASRLQRDEHLDANQNMIDHRLLSWLTSQAVRWVHLHMRGWSEMLQEEEEDHELQCESAGDRCGIMEVCMRSPWLCLSWTSKQRR
jgi:hypothetical protein